MCVFHETVPCPGKAVTPPTHSWPTHTTAGILNRVLHHGVDIKGAKVLLFAPNFADYRHSYMYMYLASCVYGRRRRQCTEGLKRVFRSMLWVASIIAEVRVHGVHRGLPGRATTKSPCFVITTCLDCQLPR